MIRLTGLAIVALFFSCDKKSEIPYPAPLPTDQFIPFMPDVIDTDSLEFNALFSPDGNSFYFSRYDPHDIYESKYDGKQWTTPVMTSFSEREYQECDAAFSPDGKKLYYISTRKRDQADSTADFDIWYVEREGENWSAPHNLEIVNSDSSEYYVSFADNGNLYFASNREGGKGSFDIYVSKFVNNEFTTPINLGDSVNDEHFEHDAYVSPDEDLLIYTSANREGGYGKGDLYYSLRDKNGNWSKAKNLGPKFNGPGYEFCSYLTRDKKYFFLSAGNVVRWIDAEQLFKVIKQ